MLLDQIKGCLLGVYIGDAFGMPVETMIHNEIMELNGGRGVIDFMDAIQKKISRTSAFKAGQTTDDSQLTAAVARSLIECKGWDKEHCAKEHVKELERSLAGWGGTTRRAIEQIRDGKRNFDDPAPNFGPGKGCGNGVMMKIAPLAIFGVIKDIDLDISLKICMDLGSLTHNNPKASVAAYAIECFIMGALAESRKSHKDAMHLLRLVLTHFAIAGIESGSFLSTDNVYGRIVKAAENIDSADKLREAMGCGFHALETVGFTIGTFLRHPTDFESGVLEVVNAGGDTDSNASIVGAMIGANVGLAGIPKKWRNMPFEAEALELAEGLYNTSK